MRNECRLEIKGRADMEKVMRAMKEMAERVIRSEKNRERRRQKEVRVRERGTCVVHIMRLD